MNLNEKNEIAKVLIDANELISYLRKELEVKDKANDQLIRLMENAVSEISNKDHVFGFKIAISFVKIALTKDNS